MEIVGEKRGGINFSPISISWVGVYEMITISHGNMLMMILMMLTWRKQ